MQDFEPTMIITRIMATPFSSFILLVTNMPFQSNSWEIHSYRLYLMCPWLTSLIVAIKTSDPQGDQSKNNMFFVALVRLLWWRWEYVLHKLLQRIDSNQVNKDISWVSTDDSIRFTTLTRLIKTLHASIYVPFVFCNSIVTCFFVIFIVINKYAHETANWLLWRQSSYIF